MIDIKVEDFPNYSLFTVRGEVKFDELKELLLQDFNVANYYDLNPIFLFETSSINMSIEEYAQVIELIRDRCPDSAKRVCAAMVFNSFFTKSMGDVFKQESDKRPPKYDVQIFNDLELAKHWTTSKVKN